jgi:hypothetical protein
MAAACSNINLPLRDLLRSIAFFSSGVTILFSFQTTNNSVNSVKEILFINSSLLFLAAIKRLHYIHLQYQHLKILGLFG